MLANLLMVACGLSLTPFSIWANFSTAIIISRLDYTIMLAKIDLIYYVNGGFQVKIA